MIPYQEHLANITSQHHAKREALEKAIETAFKDADKEGQKHFSVTIPPKTPEEIVKTVKAHYEAAPFYWPVRVSHDQREGDTMYFGQAH